MIDVIDISSNVLCGVEALAQETKQDQDALELANNRTTHAYTSSNAYTTGIYVKQAESLLLSFAHLLPQGLPLVRIQSFYSVTQRRVAMWM